MGKVTNLKKNMIQSAENVAKKEAAEMHASVVSDRPYHRLSLACAVACGPALC